MNFKTNDLKFWLDLPTVAQGMSAYSEPIGNLNVEAVLVETIIGVSCAQTALNLLKFGFKQHVDTAVE